MCHTAAVVGTAALVVDVTKHLALQTQRGRLRSPGGVGLLIPLVNMESPNSGPRGRSGHWVLDMQLFIGADLVAGNAGLAVPPNGIDWVDPSESCNNPLARCLGQKFFFWMTILKTDKTKQTSLCCMSVYHSICDL